MQLHKRYIYLQYFRYATRENFYDTFFFRDEKEKEILIEDPVKGITKVDVLGKSINTMKYW